MCCCEEGFGRAECAKRSLAPVLQAVEHALDDVACLVELRVVVDLDLAVLARRDAGGRAGLRQPVAQVVRIISAIRNNCDTLADERLKALAGLRNIGPVACRERDRQGSALAVTDEVQLGVQPASGLADGAAFAGVFFTPLAAIRCVLTWLASIISTEVSAPSRASVSNICAKTPASDQRL